MRSVPPTHPPLPPDVPLTGRPSTRSLLRWGALVGMLHLFFLLSLAGTLDRQLSSPQTLRTGPMQTRTLAASGMAPISTQPSPTPAARTRVALVEKPQPSPAPTPAPHSPPIAAAPERVLAKEPTDSAGSPEPEPALDSGPSAAANLASADPVPVQEADTLTGTDDRADKVTAAAADTQASGTDKAWANLSNSPDTASQNLPMSDNGNAPVPVQTNHPAPPHIEVKAEGPEPSQNLQKSVPSNEATAQVATQAPERITNATMALPHLALDSLPPSALLSYRLSGQEKGIHYQASGELRWQRNDSAYAMSLSVRAFLLGARHWRSVGRIDATGLAPTRFSDSWRSERAAHFDRPNQQIVFSNNAPTAPLQPGAQDQASLYVQLAAAMTPSGQRMQPGTRLQIQTATVRDALPWLLTLEKLETLEIEGKSVQAVKWVCQPRNRFDAQVEFWVSAEHHWLPARIRITQVSGSFIDLQLTGLEALTDLAPTQ
ncbi:MAG: hypothetical protein RJB14_376 [Pseudomonadota bacterium]